MRKAVKYMLLFFLIICSTLFAQESPNAGHVTLPWDEFDSLSDLSRDELVLPLDVFEKLVALTDSRLQPKKRGGYVVLTRQEFSNLIDEINASPEPYPDPPVDYLISQASYAGKMRMEDTFFKADMAVHVLKDHSFIYVPVLPQNLALEKVTVNDEPALLSVKDGYHSILVNSKGEYAVHLQFSVKSSLEEGPQKFDMSIVNTPITLLELDIPMSKIDIVIPQAQQIITTDAAKSTRIQAIISSGHNISVRWRKRLDETEKLAPKLYAEVNHLLSVDDDALTGQSIVQLNILHNEIDAVSMILPESLNILSVQGEGVGEWQERNKNGERRLLVPFTYGKKGTSQFKIKSEQTMTEQGRTINFIGFRLIDVVRETGNIGIELNSSAEVSVKNSQGVEAVPVQKLPAVLRQNSDKPLFLGFKYLKHPFFIELDVEKHKKIPVPSATVNSANAVTLFTEDGKIVHRLLCQICNSSKQFMQLQLPDKAMVWSVFVDDRPVESSLNEQGELLIPLIRSVRENNRLENFPVEVVYCIVDEPFDIMNVIKTSLPKTDLITSQIMWSVYLPKTYTYFQFKSSLEKENIIRGLNVLTTRRWYDEQAIKETPSPESSREKIKSAYRGRSYKSEFKNAPVDEKQVHRQLEAELGFSGRLEEMQKQQIPQVSAQTGGSNVGILPLQIHIPTSGQIYRFAKTIVMPEDSLYVKVSYVSDHVTHTIKWIILFAILLILFLLRRHLKFITNSVRRLYEGLKTWIQKHKKCFEFLFNSRTSPFIWLALAVLSLFISAFLALLFFFTGILIILNRFFNRQTNKKKS